MPVAAAFPAETERLSDPVTQERADGNQGKQAVNNGWDAGQNFDSGLGEAAKPATRIFGQIDRDHQAERHRQRQGDERDVESAPKQRQDAKRRTATELRVPDRREKELGGRIHLEEVDGFEKERKDDAKRRQDGDERRAE